MSKLTSLRNANALIAFNQFAKERLAFGEPSKGLGHAFADLIEVTPQVWSGIKAGKRQIGDVMARRIECRTGKPEGWLDGVHQEDPESWLRPDENELARLALDAFRRSDSEGRARLAKLIEDFGTE